MPLRRWVLFVCVVIIRVCWSILSFFLICLECCEQGLSDKNPFSNLKPP